MKKFIEHLLGLSLVLVMVSGCIENDPVPDYQIVGRSYETIASIAVSNEAPAAAETIVVTLEYINYNEDPAQTVTLIVDRNDEQTVVATFDESSASEGERTLTFNYTVPSDASGESISLIGEFRSDLEFPQLEVTEITVE